MSSLEWYLNCWNRKNIDPFKKSRTFIQCARVIIITCFLFVPFSENILVVSIIRLHVICKSYHRTNCKISRVAKIYRNQFLSSRNWQIFSLIFWRTWRQEKKICWDILTFSTKINVQLKIRVWVNTAAMVIQSKIPNLKL